MFDVLKSKLKTLVQVAAVIFASTYLVACGGGATGDQDNFIIINDQSVIDLNQINISSASLKVDSWIVIYEQDSLLDRKSEKILGKLSIGPGEYENVVATLDRDVGHGEVLYVELRRDDGELGEYDPSIDSVISQAATTAASFVVNHSSVSYIAATDQSISSVSSNTIQIDKVISKKRGWLVAYRRDINATNQLGGMLGYQRICHEKVASTELSAKAGQPRVCVESNQPIHQSKVIIGLEESLKTDDEIIIVLYEDIVVDEGGFSVEEDSAVFVNELLVSADIQIQ